MDFIKEIDAKMAPIQYGWVDKDGVKHADWAHYEKYMLKLPDQLLKAVSVFAGIKSNCKENYLPMPE